MSGRQFAYENNTGSMKRTHRSPGVDLSEDICAGSRERPYDHALHWNQDFPGSELLEGRLDYILALLIRAALLNLIAVELRDLVACNIVLSEFVFGQDPQSFEKGDWNPARLLPWVV
jgi:hypothetical protein